MKYKVGDKVRVHSKEWFEKNCKSQFGIFVHEDDCYTFANGMTKFCGQEITINKECLSKYSILEDNGQWYWEDWMFEDTNNNTNTISNPNIVEDFAKLIGVELDEEFYDSKGGFRYKFTSDSGLMVYDDMVEDWRVAFAYSLTAFFKMIKEGKFIKKWIPKDGSTVFFPAFMFDGLWDNKIYNSEDEHDKEMLKSGLYFKTQKEAIECAKQMIENRRN